MNTHTESPVEALDNPQRVYRAGRVMDLYAQLQAVDIRVEGHDTVLGDLLADLMHWSDTYAVDFGDMLRRATGHYEAESGNEATWDERDAPTPREPVAGLRIEVQDGGSGSWPIVVIDKDGDPIARFSYRADAQRFAGTDVLVIRSGHAAVNPVHGYTVTFVLDLPAQVAQQIDQGKLGVQDALDHWRATEFGVELGVPSPDRPGLERAELVYVVPTTEDGVASALAVEQALLAIEGVTIVPQDVLRRKGA